MPFTGTPSALAQLGLNHHAMRCARAQPELTVTVAAATYDKRIGGLKARGVDNVSEITPSDGVKYQ